MKVFFKASACTLAAALLMFAGSITAKASTGLYVGKDVSGDGTTLLGVTSEYEIGISAMPEVIEKGAIPKGDVIKTHNGYEYTLPEDSAKMTVVRTMSYSDIGDWDVCATNEYGVTVLSSVTTSTCADAVAADPFVDDGICEEKIPQILASGSKTAKDAVNLLCRIYDETGAESAEIVLIADQDGAWAVENFTGHQYVATKLPDDKIGVFSNEPLIRNADPDDPDTICSSKLFSLPEENDFATYDSNNKIDLILSYNEDNAYSDEPHLRVWVGHDLFAASEELDYDENDAYDNFFTPDEDVTLEKAFDFFRNRYEGTPYDLNDSDNNYYWGINNQLVSNAVVFQVFGDVPAEISTVCWDTPANPTASPFIAIPGYADSIPACFATDITEDSYADGTLQYDFIKLNNKAVTRRNTYGKSIRQYWEGMEAVSANDVRSAMEGKWKDDFEASPAKVAEELNDYIYMNVVKTQENCARITDELDWFMFRNGIRKTSVPDDEVATFECSFDAVSYARSNGWEAEVDGDTFTATKDGKTIEVIISGENEGNVTFKGFDNEKLMEDFLAEGAVEEDEEENSADDDAIPAGETEAEAEEAIEEAVEKTKESAKEEEAKEPEKEEKAKEPAKEETAKEPAKEEKAEESAKEEKAEELTKEEAAAQDVAGKLEVDTIAELESYFAEKIANVPRDGWAENEIAKQLGGVANDITKIITKHFNAKDVEDLIRTDYAKVGGDIASDPALADAADKIVNAGVDLSGLVEKYFASLSEEVTADVVSGRLNQDGAVKILTEAQNDVEGIAKIYLEGVEGAFANVFGDITEEDIKEFLGEVDDAVDVLDEYGVIDQKSLGIDGVDLEDLTDADVEVVITLNEMDQDVIDGLSDLLGVDVQTMLEQYTKALTDAGVIQNTPSAGGGATVIEEKHENETAQSAPDPEVMTAIELEEALSEEDIQIPQEVIDLLNAAIAEAHAGKSDTAKSEEVQSSQNGPADPSIENGEFTVSLGRLEKADGQVLLPAYMLRYFN